MTELVVRSYPHLLCGAVCAGLAAANAARVSVSATALAGAAIALAASAIPVAQARLVALGVALLLAAWWWGSVRLEALDESSLRRHIGASARTVAVVTGPARRGAFALRVPAVVRRFGALAPGEPVLLQLPLGRAPPQGAILELVATIEQPRADDEGFDERTWLRRRGVAVVVQGSRWRVVGRRGGVGGLADRLRSHLVETIAPGLEGERRAVVAGIVLGEDEGLPRALRDSFRASGLYHLLAVSGQNVAFLAAGILLAARLAGVSRRLGELGVLLAIAGYVLAVGWQPSVVRAGVAGALASLAWLAARPRDRWYALLLGAAVLLAWSPYSLLEPGFQLSFAAVAAIFVAVPRARQGFEGYPIPAGLADVVAVSGACAIATAPIVWLHFEAVPVYSVAANAVAAPVVAPLLGLGLAASSLHPILPWAAETLAWANGWLAAYLAGCARLVGALPGAQVGSGAVLLGLAAVGAFVFAASRLERRRRRAVLATAGVAAALGLAWRLAPEPPPPPVSGLRMTVLDVGQGDATLLQVPEGAVLVDEGPPEARVAEQLRGLGVRRLALLVLTHPSRDNIGGAEQVLRDLDVDRVLEPALPFADPYGEPALDEARRRGIPVSVARAGRRYRLGTLELAVLWPPDGRRRSGDPNDHATVLLASYGRVDALLPADAEAKVTRRLAPGQVEILKVAHHGSRDPDLLDLLETLSPRVAVISVGDGNEYGHPAPSTLGALRGVPVYRTDRDGAVVIDSDGREVRVSTER